MDYRATLLEVLLIIAVWIVGKLLRKVFKGKDFLHRGNAILAFWTVLFWGLIISNVFSLYWLAFPIAVWMFWAIILIIGQAIYYHEFIYRRYWIVFWRLSVIYSAIVFIGSTFCHYLPII